MVPVLRERYLATRNTRIAGMLTAAGKNDTERFWSAMEEMEKEAKILRRCQDGHSRSRMFFSIMTMIGHGMLGREDLLEFSQELQARVSTSREIFDVEFSNQP